MKKTKNYELNIPEAGDCYQVDDQNQNWEKMDEKVFDIESNVNELSIELDDSGWQAIIGTPAAASCIVNPAAGQPVRYRKKNGIVYVTGTLGVTGKASGSLTLFTLPSGYRPSAGYFYSVNTGTGYVMSRYVISSTGTVSLEWVRRLSDGAELTGDISWVGMDISFPV